jgi:hypothetical protein
LIRIPEPRKRPVNQANDFTEPNLGRRTAELIAPLCAAYAFDNASVFQFKQDEPKKLTRHVRLRSDVPNSNGALSVSPCERHHRLQCVQSFVRDFQSRLIVAVSNALRPRSSKQLPLLSPCYSAHDLTRSFPRDVPIYRRGSAHLISLVKQAVDQSQQAHSRKEKIQPVLLHREFHDGYNRDCKK